MVLSIITMRAPRADDLRRVLATMRAAQSLERIGDYARNTAKRTKAIMASDAGDLPWDQLIEMGTMVASMIDDGNRSQSKCKGCSSTTAAESAAQEE